MIKTSEAILRGQEKKEREKETEEAKMFSSFTIITAGVLTQRDKGITIPTKVPELAAFCLHV